MIDKMIDKGSAICVGSPMSASMIEKCHGLFVGGSESLLPPGYEVSHQEKPAETSTHVLLQST